MKRQLRNLNRRHRLVLAFVILIAIVTGLWWHARTASAPHSGLQNQSATHSQPSQTTNDNRVRLLATGDFIAHDSVNAAAKQADGRYDYLSLMPGFAEVMHKSDIRFCNDPILNGGEALGIVGYPKFNSPTAFVTDMGRLGCNLVNTASNHSFDFSQKYIDASVDAWQTVPDMLAVAGQNKTQAQHDDVSTFTVKGVKFAFLAYTSYSNSPPQNSYGLNVFSQQFAATQIAKARQRGAQVIIVSMRWGTEYAGEVNQTQKQQAQFLADQGVDVVLGHGPHVVQAASQLSGKNGAKTTVFYSLGNFLNSQIPSETLFSGIVALDFDTVSHTLTAMQYAPIYMHYEWTATEAANETLSARHNLKLYPMEEVTQAMIDANQLKTSAAEQKQRLQTTLDSMGLTIPFTEVKDL